MRGFRNKSEINQDAEIPFPADQKSLWDLKDAYRRKNAFREEICLNGLWQFLGCRDEKALLNAASANSLIKRLDFGFEGDFRYRLPAMWKGKADPEKIKGGKDEKNHINDKRGSYCTDKRHRPNPDLYGDTRLRKPWLYTKFMP